MTKNQNSQPKKSLKLQKYSIIGAGFGQNMVLTFVSTFMLVFLIEYAKISTQGMAIVTAIMSAAKVFDAFNDPMMGTIVDKTRSKMGKMRPYLIISALPVAIIATLLFTDLQAGQTAQIVFFGIIYVLWDVFYTMCDVPYWGLIGAAFPEGQQRTSVISLVRAAGTVSLGLVTLGGPWIAKLLSFSEKTTAAGWTRAAAVVSIIGMALFTLAFFNTAEKPIDDSQPKTSLKTMFVTLFKNRPLLIVLLGSTLGFGRTIVQTGGAVFAVVAYNDEGLFTLMGAAIIVGILASSLLTQFLLKKFSDKMLMISTSILGAVFYTIMYFAGFSNIYVMCAMIFLTGLTLGAFMVIQTTMLADSVDNIEKRTGVRNDGLSFSMLTFVSKLMGTFAMMAFGMAVVISGYQADTPTTPQMQDTIFFAITIVPAISCLLSALPFFFYKLPEVTEENNTTENDTAN